MIKNINKIVIFCTFFCLILTSLCDAKTYGKCGSSNGKGLYSTPTDLCSSGSASNIVGTGHPTWSWDCSGSEWGLSEHCGAYGITLENGVCGSANGQSFSSQPSYSLSTLCSSGTTISISGTGPWTWACQGSYGGVTVWCSAEKDICGSSNNGTFNSIPVTGLCASGTASNVSGTGPWTWTCTENNKKYSCSAQKKSNDKINGVCGSSHNQSFSLKPITDLCSVGIASVVAGSNPWYWTCSGSNGGKNASCSTCSSTWDTISTPNGENIIWGSPAYGNSIFVSIGYDSVSKNYRVMTSPDGIAWTMINYVFPSPIGTYVGAWRPITFGNGLFVVVDGGGGKAMTSPDGINWTKRSFPSPANNMKTWGPIIYANNLFVVASNGYGWLEVATSSDGINWTKKSIYKNILLLEEVRATSITYGNGLFVIVSSDKGRTATSPDGINWTIRSVSEVYGWDSITFGNGLFVATAHKGDFRVMTSPDGINWKTNIIAYSGRNNTIYADGLFYIGGGSIMSSSDGINWSTVIKQVPDGFNGNSYYLTHIDYGNGIFFGVTTSWNTTRSFPRMLGFKKCGIINGTCGSSDSQTSTSIPTTNLCSTGTASSVSGTGPWTWTCSGSNGGTNASCGAQKTADTTCTWTCGSWSTCNNGTQTRTCTSSPAGSGCTGDNPYPMSQSCSVSGNVQCGSANNGSFTTEPTENLCTNGSLLIMIGDGPWYWVCQDENKQKGVLCLAKKEIVKVDGQCGDSNGKAFESKPKSNLCEAGTASSVYGSGPWLWLCNGINGGKFSFCLTQK